MTVGTHAGLPSGRVTLTYDRHGRHGTLALQSSGAHQCRRAGAAVSPASVSPARAAPSRCRPPVTYSATSALRSRGRSGGRLEPRAVHCPRAATGELSLPVRPQGTGRPGQGATLSIDAQSFGDLVRSNSQLQRRFHRRPQTLRLRGAGDLSLAAGTALTRSRSRSAADQGGITINGSIDALAPRAVM